MFLTSVSNIKTKIRFCELQNCEIFEKICLRNLIIGNIEITSSDKLQFLNTRRLF